MENKKLVVVLVLVVVVSLGTYLFIRNGCVSFITYIPESQKPTRGGLGGQGIIKTEGHYEIRTTNSSGIENFVGSLGFEQFKTRNEAISYCMSRKFGLGD